MRESYMLAVALPPILIYLRKVMKHPSSSGCLYLHHITLFWTLRGCQSMIFCMKFESVFWQKWHDNDHKGLINATRSSFNHPYTSMVGYEALKQQCMSLPKVQHPVYQAEGVPTISHFAWNLRVVFNRNDMHVDNQGLIIAVRSFSNHHHTHVKGFETPKQ